MLTTPIYIRPAKLIDINSLVEISVKTFNETFAGQNTKENMEKYINEKFTTSQLLAELNDEQNKFFLAVLNGHVIGYAKLRTSIPPEQINYNRTIEIEGIYVSKAYHDMKVGASLINYCIDNAVENKFDVIWLGVWEHNPKAIKFYERWGFHNFGSHVFILGNDSQTDLLMKKELT